jgi:hypothetical protein
MEQAFKIGRVSTACIPISGYSVSINGGMSEAMIEEHVEENTYLVVKELAKCAGISGGWMV